MMVFMVCQTSTCGPGIGYKTRPSNLFVSTRQPDVAENAKTASGKFGNPLMKNDSRLQRITSTQIVFADNRYESNCRKAIKVCRPIKFVYFFFSLLHLSRKDGHAC